MTEIKCPECGSDNYEIVNVQPRAIMLITDYSLCCLSCGQLWEQTVQMRGDKEPIVTLPIKLKGKVLLWNK